MHEQVIFFDKVIFNIFHNFILNKLIICDDEDIFWMNDETKTLIKKKNWFYQRQKRSNNVVYKMGNAITTDIFNGMNSFKFKYQNYLAKELNGAYF